MGPLARPSHVMVALAAAAIAAPTGAQEPPDSMSGPAPALTHVRHVATTFRGTPENQGLLPTAVAEAEIARQHATLAKRDPTDLDAVARHTRHVLNALDPSLEESGPGLGYGAVVAAERTAHYIALAAASEGASDAVKTHATHIETAARNAVSNGEAAIEVAQEILESFDTSEGDEEAEAEDAEEASRVEEEAGGAPEEEAEAPNEPPDYPALLERLVSLTQAMVEGVDVDGDGRIGWQEPEGGLAQATRHLELLQQAAGLGGR